MASPPRTQVEEIRRSPGSGTDVVVPASAPGDTTRYWVEGDAYPRIVLDVTAGDVLIGPGTTPPVSVSSGGGGGGQPLNSNLTAIAALPTLTTFGMGFLNLVDAAGGRSKLALGTASTFASTAFDAAGAAATAQSNAIAASQPSNSNLTALAGQATQAYGRSLLNTGSSSAARTLLGVSGGATDFTSLGWVTLDSYQTGTLTDDQLLDAAIADVTNTAIYAFPPPIRLSNRLHQWVTNGRDPIAGVVVVGPGLKFNAADSSNAQNRNFEIHLNFDTSQTGIGWWHLTDVSLKRRGFGLLDLCIVNNSGSNFPSVVTCAAGVKGFGGGSVLGENCTGIGLWSWAGYRNPFNDNVTHGSVPASQACVATASLILAGSHTNINGGYSTTCYLSGSGIELFRDGGLLDSPDSRHQGNGEYHVRMNLCEESTVGDVYITGEGRWGCVLVEGNPYNTSHSNASGPVNFFGTRMEGQLSTNPNYGNVYRQTGGVVNMYGVLMQYGMTNAALTGRTPIDAGYAMVTDGMLNIFGMSTDKATGVAQTVPIIDASGGAIVNVRGVSVIPRFGAWTQLPTISDRTNAAGSVTSDLSVIQATRWDAAFQLDGSQYLRQPFSTYVAGSDVSLTSGVMRLVAIPCQTGDVITNLTFSTGTTAAVTPTHWWFAWYDPTLTKVGQSADQTTTAMAANTPFTLPLAAGPFTCATTGVYYAGICVAAATPPSVVGRLTSTQMNAGPVAGMLPRGGTNGAGLTATAPAGPLTLTGSANLPWASTS